MVSTKYFLFILAIVYCSVVFSQEDAPPTIIINNDNMTTPKNLKKYFLAFWKYAEIE